VAPATSFSLCVASIALFWSGALNPPADPPPNPLDRIWQANFSVSPASSAPLRILDWNIDRGKRFEPLAAALERERPDLCFFQEADLFARRSGGRNVPEELARRLKMNYVFAPEFQELAQGDSGRPSYQGQATLSRLPVRTARILRFRDQSGFWKPRPFLPQWTIMQRRLGGRNALVTELEWNGGLLVVYNAHLESRSWGRLQSLQLDEILADARRYPEKTPVILAGDLNSAYNMDTMIAQFRKAGFTSVFGERRPRTNVLMFSIDWILVRGPIASRDAMVVRGAGASDHFPISAVVAPLS
jgi:endonuclease/exonuclease/phosphatase family metal-dependent hydrolase